MGKKIDFLYDGNDSCAYYGSFCAGLEDGSGGHGDYFCGYRGNITFDTSTGTITDCDESVTEAVIPDTIGGVLVEEVGIRAFGSCINLSSVELPDSVTVIEAFAFDNCSSLNSVKMPKNLENIESWAFRDCGNLSSIEIPDKTRKIGEKAFQNCAGLDSIEIPASVISIGNSAFGYCSGLRSIKVDKNNTAYTSEDGVLFDKEKPRYFVIPLGKGRPCMRFQRV